MMEWISVKDRLPEPYIEVLANFIGWDDMNFQRVLEYCSKDKIFYNWQGETYKIDKVTHWMKLTEPPKQ